MQESAFLLKELTCEIEDVVDEKKISYHYDNGLISFVDYINEDKKTIVLSYKARIGIHTKEI